MGISCLSACGGQGRDHIYIEFSGLTMGSTYDVKLELPAGQPDRDAIRQGIADVFGAVDNAMSTYKPESELSRINTALTTDPIPVSAELFNVLTVALDISRYTQGAFDITVGPLVNLWGFGPHKHQPVLPAAADLNLALARTGYQKLSLDAQTRTLRKAQPDMYLDLSGIASGYAVDRVAAYLDSLSVANYMVDASGEIKTRGVNAEGQTWRIGIEKPVSDQRQIERIIRLENMGMDTSGDYRNYFEMDGKHYSHIIDPASGWPVPHTLVSASVLDPSATRADALATSLMVMGPERGVAFARDHGLTAMFIVRQAEGFSEIYTGTFPSLFITD